MTDETDGNVAASFVRIQCCDCDTKVLAEGVGRVDCTGDLRDGLFMRVEVPDGPTGVATYWLEHPLGAGWAYLIAGPGRHSWASTSSARSQRTVKAELELRWPDASTATIRIAETLIHDGWVFSLQDLRETAQALDATGHSSD